MSRFRIVIERAGRDPMDLVLRRMNDRASFLQDCYENMLIGELIDQVALMQQDLHVAQSLLVELQKDWNDE